MDVAFIRRRWSNTGGSEHYLQRLASTLHQQGHRVTLLCERWQTQREASPFYQVVEFKSRASKAFQPWAFARAVNAWLQSHTFDGVLSLERGISSAIYRAGDGVHRHWLKQKARHGLWFTSFLQYVNLKHTVQCHLEKVTFTHAPKVIANSNMVAEQIRRYFHYPSDQMRVIYNGVDYSDFSTGDRHRGRLALKVDEKEFVLLLVGAGAKRKGHAQARQVAERLGFPSRLVIIDTPPPCSMADAYASADVFLFPSLYDPFANVTLEAMSAGLPVITTQDNGAHEILKHGKNGFVVSDANAIKDMVQLIRELRDGDLRKSIGIQAQDTAQEFSLEKNAQETLDFLLAKS